jgi:hypothetical protein
MSSVDEDPPTESAAPEALGDGRIVPILITLEDKTGVTLYAPPWEDATGEEWQGFLGDGAKIVLFPSAGDLKEFIDQTPDNDLSDHPDWERTAALDVDELQPTEENTYDLEEVYEWAAGDADAEAETELAKVIELVLRIAESCEDGALRRLIGATPEYAELLDDQTEYSGSKEARARWTALGDTIADTWGRALKRVDRWLDWRGDFSEGGAEELTANAMWQRVSARPIELVLPDDEIVLTVRGTRGKRVLFLGTDGEIEVFEEPEDMAEFCREADEHDLIKLEFWDVVREADDEAFVPDEQDSYDLTAPSSRGATLLGELARFCELEADAGFLTAKRLDPKKWAALVASVRTCLVTD